MKSFSEILSEHNIEITSPDGGICVELEAGEIRQTYFGVGRYAAYSESSLEGQLASIAKLVFVTRRRARQEALRLALGHEPDLITDPGRIAKSQELNEARSELEVEVQSENMLIRVLGGLNWIVKIRPGTIRYINERDFLAELNAAVQSARDSWEVAMRELRAEIYGYQSVGSLLPRVN